MKRMNKEYVKPEILVVYISDKLMQDERISFNPNPGGDDDFAKEHFEDDFDSGDSPKNLWDD